jgi:hypothetical protein
MSEYTLDDGRKAEKVENNVDPLTKVTEVYVEPKPQKKLSKRITERLCVCEREIEVIDETTGQVVDRVLEKVCEGASEQKQLELKSPMQKLVEDKIKGSANFKNYLFALVVFAQIVALGYVIFFM